MADRPTYESILFDQRETMLDQLGRALAGVEGKPIGSEDASPDDEDAAWLARDKRVTAEHLAMLTQQTMQELAQETDETGNPKWTPEEIATEVKARHTAAQFPYRHLTYTLGVVDPSEQAAKAERVRKRVERKYGPQSPDAAVWQDAPDDYQPGQGQQPAPGLADLMSTDVGAADVRAAQRQPARQVAPGQDWNY